MSSLVVGNFIGAGGYGNVYHARWEGRKVAVKRFPLAEADVHQADAIQHEVRMLQQLVDRHIIQFYGTAYHEGKLVLIMDYAEGGSLQRAIEHGRVTDWPTRTRIAQEMMRGLAYIHHKQVLHRDLKSMNVLLTRHMEVKLCDFGLATVKIRSSSLSKSNEASSSSSSLKGTFRWMAPELLVARPRYSTKSDMYALGMVLWEMAANRTVPFREQPDNFMVMALVKGGEREVLPENTPADYCRWVERCWDQDPENRPEASDLIANDGDDDDDNNQHQRLDILDGAGADTSAVSVSMDISVLSFLPSSSSLSSNDSAKDDDANGATSQSPEEINALRAKAHGGDVEAQMELAARFERGSASVKQSDSEAFKWYFRAAAKDSIEAQFKIGKRFLEGLGTLKNQGMAVYWMRQAAEKGHARAQNSLGRMYRHGIGVDQNNQEAVRWYRASADQGNAVAQKNLGAMYSHGYGVERDYGEAVSWYSRSAEQGNAAAQYNLGVMYHYSIGVEQDESLAATWYRRSAEQGNARAQNSLGEMYQAGSGVAQDHGEAVAWFQRAAEHGHAAAQRNLGWMYHNGLGVEQDCGEAVAWYSRSAGQGNALAQYHLGLMYESGQGVSKDIEQAIQWYRKAAQQQDVHAKKRLGALEKPKDSFFKRIFG